ncbi:hypothetical protein [Paenibacillus sp. IHBB 3054]|uniref:hypothetical protein n=1 Tax=Paenibacillus sp. IHBB 3054 TaxID=3425689 RepID=UPI003F6793A9
MTEKVDSLLTDNRTAIKEKYLNDLIQGGSTDQAAELLGLRLDFTRFTVLTLELEEPQQQAADKLLAQGKERKRRNNPAKSRRENSRRLYLRIRLFMHCVIIVTDSYFKSIVSLRFDCSVSCFVSRLNR